MVKIKIAAKCENLDFVNDFIEEQMEMIDCPAKISMQIRLAVEEVFVNISTYAYPDQKGDTTITCDISGEPPEATIEFFDSGIPFNPLSAEDPDFGLSTEDRELGGLGVFLVKKTMNSVEYKYSGNQNILTLKKILF